MSECRKLQELTIKDNFMFGAVMVDEELCKEFLELALGFRIFQDGFVQKLQDAVRNVKASREMEERYMLLQELLKEEREAGRAEGRAEGRAQGRAEGKAEGRAQGRAEGRAEGKAESILELLSDLGDIPEDLQKRISVEKDPNVLKSYLKIASASKTIDEFRKRIDQP